MAKPNKKGTAFLGLGLDPAEVVALKKFLKDKDISANQLQRYLIRVHLKETGYVKD